MTIFTRTFLVLAMAAFGSTAMAAIESTGDYKPNEVIVKYKDGVRRNRMMMQNIYDVANVVKVNRFNGTVQQFDQLTIEAGTDIKQVISELEKLSTVEYAQPNYILRVLPVTQAKRPSDDGGIPCIPGMEVPGCTPMPCIIPGWPPGCEDGGGGGGGGEGRPPVADKPADVNPPEADPSLSKAYGISKIASEKAWEKTKGSANIVVAVIDTGVDYNHEDLSFNMWRNPNPTKNDLVGYDFIHDDGLPFDDNQHGTHVAGTIGAVGGNGKGVSGVNQRVSIMALKFLSGEGSGDTAGAIKAIDYAVTNGAKVMNASWGGGADEGNNALRESIERAEKADVLFVAAAGNGGNDGRGDDNDKEPMYPAAFNTGNMLAVAATNANDRLTGFSNFGKRSVHLAAPGDGVYSTVPGNKYASLSGTSMACPHVAGAAALVWSMNPKMSHKEVKARLMDSVDKISGMESKTITGGRLNVGKAVSGL